MRFAETADQMFDKIIDTRQNRNAENARKQNNFSKGNLSVGEER